MDRIGGHHGSDRRGIVDQIGGNSGSDKGTSWIR